MPIRLLLTAALLSAATAAPAQTLKAIKERKAMVVGYLKDAYPMSFDGDKGADGYSIELCRRIADEAAKAVGLEKIDVKYVPMTIDNKIEMVTSGKVDIDCSTTTVTLSRMAKVDFTSLIFVDAGGLLVQKGSSIRNIAGLVGESVAVVPGTTTATALKEAIADSYVNTKVVEVKDRNAGVEAVQSGKVSAYASDRIILAGVLSRDQSEKLDLVPMQFSVEPYAFMVRRGDADFRLVANRALSRAYRSQDIGNIFARYFKNIGPPGDVLLVMYMLNRIPE